jgi:hypothetical protein
MKGYCFLILAVAFLMYFQKEPIFTVVILATGFGVYLFIKAKKSGKGMFNFLSGNEHPSQDRMNDVITFLMLQQLLSNNSNNLSPQSQTPEKRQDKQLDSVEKEIMALFEKRRSNAEGNISNINSIQKKREDI